MYLLMLLILLLLLFLMLFVVVIVAAMMIVIGAQCTQVNIIQGPSVGLRSQLPGYLRMHTIVRMQIDDAYHCQNANC